MKAFNRWLVGLRDGTGARSMLISVDRYISQPLEKVCNSHPWLVLLR
jgi:hypothetical protein